jgi:uncharacterized LabA/DUF88 family protein
VTTQPTQSENNDTPMTVAGESHAPQDQHATRATRTPDSTPQNEEQPSRPFTAYIEEFRQSEGRSGDAPATLSAPAQDENQGEQAEASNPAERPVSPLLRPASRSRAPRFAGRHRDREKANTPAAQTQTESATEHIEQTDTTGHAEHTDQSALPASGADTSATPTQAEAVEQPAATTESARQSDVPASEQQETQRPPRRYRFDRPANKLAHPSTQATQATPAGSAQSATSAAVSSTPATPRPEYGNGYGNGNGSERETKEGSSPTLQNGHETTESVAEKIAAPGEAAPNGGASRHGPRQNDRHARHTREQRSQERAPEKEAETIAATPAASENPAPIVEATVSEVGLEEVAAESSLPVEDLPPLEYADLQAANARRRRRRRPGGNGTLTPKPVGEQPTSLIPSQTQSGIPSPVVPNVPARSVTPSTTYTIQSGYTVNQMNQGNDASGPFMGPDPSPARGSFAPTPVRSVRPNRNGFGSDGQRSVTGSTSVTPVREGGLSSGSVNHLANVISQAMQAQTDRMVAELRRANQGPTNISVALPPFPSTERVGVFVDVANLLYSARTMRINIDFGKLLDFLRGNRRLVRAQAYCPTSPQPGDDQMFLQAVKGLGYRITTKDYKTFSSGAKKADLDLDLCMDVVRIVDGRAVDCIVLVSGDGDFIPMLDYCSDHGVRVEVAAFDESMSATLRQSCDLFINLSMLEEVRA